jgi:cytoskeletal protein CcmA (bactofilin family)
MDQTLPATEITALLGRGTRFEGKLYFEGRVRIDGAFAGEIKSDDTLIIGDGAEVNAEIDVATVIVRGGSVHGNVRAKTSIEIHAPAKLVGNIHSPSVFIDRGVEFQGSCRMDPGEDRPAAEKSAEKPAREPAKAPPLPQPRA